MQLIYLVQNIWNVQIGENLINTDILKCPASDSIICRCRTSCVLINNPKQTLLSSFGNESGLPPLKGVDECDKNSAMMSCECRRARDDTVLSLSSLQCDAVTDKDAAE